jgi:dolichol-phosphate mannosyltransferase
LTAFLNEESNLPVFKERVLHVLRTCGVTYEIVLIDDHSTDKSQDIAKAWLAEDANVQYLRLARSCGSHAAYAAGLAKCTGDCAILLAADLQDPPETIPELLRHWNKGFDVVWAARTARQDVPLRTRFCAALYYWLMRRFALPDMPAKGADFLLMDRKVVDAYNAIPEKNTSFLAMILWLGFRQTSIEYVKQARASGKSKWSFSKKLKLAVDSLVSFSYAPIRLMSLVGACVSILGFLYAAFTIANALYGHPIQGWASLMVVTLMLGGFQLLMLGVLGEYLWRAFDEARGRPRYIIEEYCRAPVPNGPPRMLARSAAPSNGTTSTAGRASTDQPAAESNYPGGESL